MSSLKKNFAYNIAYQILVIILPLITAPYVSRVLGVEGVGTYSYIYSIAYYFGLFGMLGISNQGNRSIALSRGDKDKVSQVFWSIYSIQLCTTAIALIAYCVFMVFFFKGNKTVAYIDALFVVGYLLDINWFFFGMEKFKLTVTRNTLFKIMTVICTFVFVKKQSDLWIYTLILALGTVISQLYLWICLPKYVSLKKPKWDQVKTQIKPILVLFIPVIAYSIYKVMDKIMLGSMTNVVQVGYYENAEKIVGIPVGIITAFGTVMMPRITSLIASDNVKKAREYNKMSCKYFTCIVVGMVAGLIGVSNILPGVYFGDEFRECGKLIAGLSFTLIFMTWANIIRTQYLIPLKQDKPYVISTIVGAVVNLIGNSIFIPRLGALGALIGTVTAEFLVFFVQAMFVKKKFPIAKYLKTTLVFWPMGAVMCIVIYMIGEARGESITTLCLQVLVGVIIYLVLVIGYLFITKDEMLINIGKRIKDKINFKS